jgi:predicted alpha/beta superfamily hydrolase
MMRLTAIFSTLLFLSAFTAHGRKNASPLEIGQTTQIQSSILSETRVINSFVPYGHENQRLPVLYLLDGGLKEDFLHIAGLLQVGVSNGTLAPHILIGIENTQRRRDLTGSTSDPEDLAMAPVVGGSGKFRRFLKEELITFVDKNFQTTPHRTIIGESLAGLFVIETLRLEPDLFDAYIAVDPSVWWDRGRMVNNWQVTAASKARIYIATSKEASSSPHIIKLGEVLESNQAKYATFTKKEFLSETHSTVFHPAALDAFRQVLRK